MMHPAFPDSLDVAGARRLVAGLLDKAGIESPALDARLLVGHALALDHGGLIAQGTRLLSADERARLAALAARRLAGEPVARILGIREFFGLPFALSRATLVPRPETECVVEAAIAAVAERRDTPLRIADLGTGSGAILLALLHELPQARGIGTDRDAQALATARDNARALTLDARAVFAVADFGAPLSGYFDLVVSNPPYIESATIESLPREVRDFDPRLALDGGADGLAAYRTIAAQAAAFLAAGGALVVEIGRGQERDVQAVFAAQGLRLADFRRDLSGIVRALVFRGGNGQGDGKAMLRPHSLPEK
jgi:release factor glutamine methyltransferase